MGGSNGFNHKVKIMYSILFSNLNLFPLNLIYLIVNELANTFSNQITY